MLALSVCKNFPEGAGSALSVCKNFPEGAGSVSRVLVFLLVLMGWFLVFLGWFLVFLGWFLVFLEIEYTFRGPRTAWRCRVCRRCRAGRMK